MLLITTPLVTNKTALFQSLAIELELLGNLSWLKPANMRANELGELYWLYRGRAEKWKGLKMF